jgi:protein-S-isoprenylcysteine O-methyltransferase Ste14
MFYDKVYPYILVVIQLSCLVFVLVTAPLLAKDYAGILTESLGLFLGVYAIFEMKIGNLNITSRLKKDGFLVTTGPYSFIRHPMYSAQVIAIIPLVMDYFSYYRLGAIILLVFALLLKIRYEEKLLREKFPEYAAYASRTKRLIPYVY